MNVTRREAIAAGGGALGALCLGGCARLAAEFRQEPPRTAGTHTKPTRRAVRLSNRLTFGHRPGDLGYIERIGAEAYVDQELAARRREDRYLTLMLYALDSLRVEGIELGDVPQEEMAHQLQQAALLRSVLGRNQLKERLADLWTNHFNIYALKARGAYLLAHDERSVIREHALGRFPDMVKASARSPSMLAYLDSPQNRKSAPNENYARELLELHTLGVDGGYSQRDVMEVARCFTGWSVEDRFLRPRGKFRFVKEEHDDGAKTVLGVRIPAGGGEEDVERVLDIVTTHPSTARHISRKLCREFLGTTDTTWVDRLAKTYSETGGDIRAMLRPMLLSEDLIESPPIVKRPLDFVASALRAMWAYTDGERPILKYLEQMGQPLHQWPMPDGFPTEPSAWGGSMLGRWNFASALVENRIPGTDPGPMDLRSEYAGSAEALVLGRASDAQQPVRSAPFAVALCICSPEFQWR